jgi:hypothetical protein
MRRKPMTRYIRTITTWLTGRLAAGHLDRGAITTETAVVTFLLVVAAGVVVALIQGYAVDVVNSLPAPGG